MTLHALRLTIGDDDFLRLLRGWVAENAGRTVTTADFVSHAERVSGRQLDDFFDAWLYTPAKPATLGPP
jgi:aminopeptidase N